MVNTKDILKKRREYVYKNSNKEIANKQKSGKPVSKAERSKIYKKSWKEAIKKFPLKK